MARQPIAELQVQVRELSVVTVRSRAVAKREPRGDLKVWIQRASIPWGALVGGGLGLAFLGAVLASVNPIGFLGTLLFSSMITFGGGLVFLGGFKAWHQGDEHEPASLPPPAVSPQVAQERQRRICAVLQQQPVNTFEAIQAQLRWTETALIEALLQMKQDGLLEEDLDLETGEWVYRLTVLDKAGQPASLMLEDRLKRYRAES